MTDNILQNYLKYRIQTASQTPVSYYLHWQHVQQEVIELDRKVEKIIALPIADVEDFNVNWLHTFRGLW